MGWWRDAVAREGADDDRVPNHPRRDRIGTEHAPRYPDEPSIRTAQRRLGVIEQVPAPSPAAIPPRREQHHRQAFRVCAAFFGDTRQCLIELTFAGEGKFTDAQVAASIVHEGVHARLLGMGLAGHPGCQAREERLCRKASWSSGSRCRAPRWSSSAPWHRSSWTIPTSRPLWTGASRNSASPTRTPPRRDVGRTRDGHDRCGAPARREPVMRPSNPCEASTRSRRTGRGSTSPPCTRSCRRRTGRRIPNPSCDVRSTARSRRDLRRARAGRLRPRHHGSRDVRVPVGRLRARGAPRARTREVADGSRSSLTRTCRDCVASHSRPAMRTRCTPSSASNREESRAPNGSSATRHYLRSQER